RSRDSKERRKRGWQETIQRYRKLRAEVQSRFDTDSRRAEEQCSRALEESSQTREQEWRWTVNSWRDGLAQFATQSGSLQFEDGQRFPAWDSERWANWSPSAEILPVVRFGSFHVDLAQIPKGLPGHDRLRTDLPTSFLLPAMISFPEN